MSRTNGGEIRFDEVEKEALRRVIWRMAEFCGVKVVTYCVMGNHVVSKADCAMRLRVE